MKILVFGPGVIGTLYAARLQESGQLVTVLARGERLAEIRRHGLTLEDVVSGRRSTTAVGATEQLAPDDQYDVALVTVRRDQLASVMPALKANRNIPTMLFMLNNPVGSNDLVSALGEDRLLLGFPGAGGTSDGHIVRYALISQQPTTLGELNGRSSERVRSSGGSVQGGRLFDHDIGRHGWVAEGPCLFRHSRQWRDLYGWGQLPASVRGQRQSDSDDQGCAGRVRRRALAWPDRDAIPPDGPLYVAAAIVRRLLLAALLCDRYG